MFERYLQDRSDESKAAYKRKDREVKQKVKELKRRADERWGERLTENFRENKKKLDYDRKVWEALEIKKANCVCGPGRGMNEDWGSHVKTDAWKTVFNTMD